MYSVVIYTLTLVALANGAAISHHNSIARAVRDPQTFITTVTNHTYSLPRHRTHTYAPATRSKRAADAADTPAPTGPSSADTTVHISDPHDFALLLPSRDGELVSESEGDAHAYCTPGSKGGTCRRYFSDGFVRAAAVSHAEDGTYVQITGCLDTSKFPFAPEDDGGQLDVRYPNGAQCTFGGYGASFIEQLEPAASRFCLRCCRDANDQDNCNSHRDKDGCLITIPGVYDFPDRGVSCG